MIRLKRFLWYLIAFPVIFVMSFSTVFVFVTGFMIWWIVKHLSSFWVIKKFL
jgi:hypothetical protein